MDPTQKNGFEDANPVGGMGGVPGGSVFGGQAVVPGVQPVVSDTQYVMSGAQPMMPGEQATNATPMNLGISLSSGDKDIVLNSGAKRKSKKWWIVGVLVVVVVAIGVIGFAFLFLNKTQRAEGAFSDLRYYLENGYGGNEEGDDELVYAVSIWDKDEGVISDYYSALEEKKNTFLKMDSGLSGESLSEFNDLLKVLNNLINYKYTENMLVSSYENDGFDAAQSYFARNIDCGLVNERIEPLCSAEELYYDGVLGRFMAYYDNKCIRSGLFDGLCLDSATGSDDSVTEMVERGDSAEYLFEKVRNSDWYRILSDEIKRTNSELSEELKNA